MSPSVFTWDTAHLVVRHLGGDFFATVDQLVFGACHGVWFGSRFVCGIKGLSTLRTRAALLKAFGDQSPSQSRFRVVVGAQEGVKLGRPARKRLVCPIRTIVPFW